MNHKVCIIDAGAEGTLRPVEPDDFHRLLSHVAVSGHVCSPACAESVLVGEDDGLPFSRREIAILGGDPSL